MIEEFKTFILRGNLVELAVAFILGLAFSRVVTVFTEGIIGGIIAAVVGEPSIGEITFEINGGFIRIGAFIDSVINFLIVGFVLFLVVKAYSALKARRAVDVPEEPEEQIMLLRDIRDSLAGPR